MKSLEFEIACVVLAGWAALCARGDTKLWYRFDDKPAGYVTTGSDSFTNSVDAETYSGIPYTVGGGPSTWNTTPADAMPMCGGGFPEGYYVFDPLTGRIHPNTGSVFFVNATTNFNSRSGAVMVADNPALYGDAFTIEFFMRGFTYPNPWQGFFSRIDSNGKCTLLLRAQTTNINGTYMFVTNGVSTAASIDSVNMGTSLNDSKWRHVAITVDQVQLKLKVYVDYSLIRTVTLPGPLDISGGGHLVLGKGTDNYGFFQGEFDEFRVSEGALLPAQFLHIQRMDDPRVFYYHSFTPIDNIFSRLSSTFVNEVAPSPAPYVTTNAPASFANICEWSDAVSRTNEHVGFVQSATAGANAAFAIPLNDPHILTNGDFTIEFFVRIPPDGTKSESYLIELNDGVRARFNNNSTTLNVMQGWTGRYSIPLADDRWHHVAWVVDRSNASVRIYFDYYLQGGISYTMPNLGSTAKVYIGSYSGGACKFNTLWLDEVRITKAVLDGDTFLRPKRGAAIETCRVPFTSVLDDFLKYGYGFNGRSVVRPTPWGSCPLDTTNRPSAMIYEGALDGMGYTNAVSAAFVGNGSGASGFYKVPDDRANPMSDGSFTAEMFVCCGSVSGWGLNVCNQCFMGQKNAFRVEFVQNPKTIYGIGPTGASFANQAIELGRWYHIAYVQDKEKDELRFYLDRKLVGTKSGIPARTADPGEFIYLMCSPIQEFAGCFASAWADEARFTRRALDPDAFLRPYPKGGLYIIFR